MRGYFGIGIYNGKTSINQGTLWRSAYIMGAQYVFTIGRRWEKQASDTTKSWRHLPMFHYQDMRHFLSHIPFSCAVIGIEQGGANIKNFIHPERAIYILGAEDTGLPDEVLGNCVHVIEIPSHRPLCMNVAVAGSIVMYDRLLKS